MEVKRFGILRSLSKDDFERRFFFQPEVHFCILGQRICPYFRADRLYKSKDTKQYKFGNVKAYLK